MDPNFLVLFALLGGAAVMALAVAVLQSETLREFGVWGALRRRFSKGYRLSRSRWR